MNFQRFEKIDKRIISTATVTLLLSLLLFWQDAWIYRLVQRQHGELEQIGEVTVIENDVRRRFEVALSWLPLSKRNEVYQGDSIFTGKNSTVVIETKSGERITIAPNSLVVINKKQDSLSIDIGFGSVQGKVDKGKKLFVTSNNNLAELDGDNATVKIDAGEGNNLVLNVIAGEVKVKSGSSEKTLRQDDLKELTQKGDALDVNRPPVQLLAPLANQIFKLSDDKPIVFQWKTARPFSRMKLKIASDPNFKNVVQDARVDGDSFSAYNLPRDTPLYWQLLTEGGTSTVNSFGLVGERAPTPVNPTPGFQFFYDPAMPKPVAGSRVTLSWEAGSLTTHYELQLASDLNFKNILHTHKTKEKTFTFELLTKGNYFWRVRSIDFENLAWSPTSSFKVGPEPTQNLAAPIPLLTDNTAYLPTKLHGLPFTYVRSVYANKARQLIETWPVIRWSTVAGADKYTLQVSRNSDFTDLVINKSTLQNFFTWKRADLGDYYWRVRGESASYKNALYSRVQKLKIALQPPQNLSKTLITDEVPDPILLNAPPPPLKLTWNPTVYTKFYELEFSDKSSFANSQKYIVEATNFEVEVKQPGLFYWRLRSLDERKTPMSPFTTAYTIEFQRIYKDPTLVKNLIAVYPKQQDSIILVGRHSSEIEFKWSKPYDDAKYRIELSTAPDFQNIFFTAESNENFYKYTETLPDRVIYWRVRAETKDFVTDWTGANRFLISYESTPFDFEQSDLMFQARLRAKERQQELLAAQRRRLLTLRTPASALELRLDTPQMLAPIQKFVIESNLDPALSVSQLTRQPFEKFFSQVRNYPTFKWEKVPAAERYVFEIARDREFTKIVSKTPCWNPYFTWEAIRPGQFYYRIQAFNDRYNRSNYSEIESLSVSVTSPVITSADNFVEVFDEPRDMWAPPSPFTLSWTPVVFSRGYEVEFSEKLDFKIAKVFKTQDVKAEFRVSKSGLYYWRVRPINENGIGIGEFSSVRSVEVIQTHRGPASAGELTGLYPTDRTLVFVGKGLMNLPFLWSSQEPDLRIEISSTANFEKVLTQIDAKNGSAVVNSNLPPGRIYWRLRSREKISPVYDFFLRREYLPYEPETTTAPATAGI